MTPRDQRIALSLIGVVTLTVAAAGSYLFVWQPLQKQKEAEAALQKEIDDLDAEARKQAVSAKKLAVARTRSLPPDEALARREYVVALERLLESSGAPKGYTITPRVVDNTARAVPEVSKGKPIYTKLAYEVTIKKADMWIVKDFLRGYYGLGLLHQITAFNIKKEEETAKGPQKRNDLTVVFTTEAVIVDGAENRRTLLPVPTAFAAVGGGAMFQSMRYTPEAGRGVAPPALVPVLATKPRDYSLIVLKDPFNGPLVPPPPFKLSPIKDLKVVQDDKASSVKVAVSGEGATGTKVVAVASGPLFPEGALRVDAKTLAIEIPKTAAAEGTSTISVIATSIEGKVEKTAFKVTASPKPPEKEVIVEDKRIEIDGAIILTMVTSRSDGTASAAIRDAANRQRYEIEVTGKKVTVSKYYYIKDKKKEESDPNTDGVLFISDDNTKTKRTFKIIAVDADALVLQDQKPAAPKPKAPGGFGGGGFGGGGFGGKGAAPKQGPAAPLAVLAGNMTNGVSLLPGKVYRWPVGQSLKSIEELTDSEAKKVLKQAADTGPMLDIVSQ
ncbi:MAG: hypothetical protein ACKODX_04985 [Gemmata sp.]|jgi:hypothetical protein